MSVSLRDRLNPKGLEDEKRTSLSLIQGRVHHKVVTRLSDDLGDPNVLNTGAPDTESLRAKAIGLAEQILDAEYPSISPLDRSRLLNDLCHDIFAFGPITDLLNDPTVSEIMVNGPREVYAERNGKIVKTAYEFRDAHHVIAVVEKILAPLGRRVDESSPMVDARMPDGSRVNVIIPPVCLNGPTITIRKFKEDGLDITGLVKVGTMTQEMAHFLKCCVETKQNIIVAGGTGTGKTTTLNALSNFIPPEDRVVTIEDAAELRLRPGHVLSLEARPPNAEGRGEVTIRELLRNSLRMRPDRMVIGEVRGGEALDLLQAMNTGHDGCLSTLHANRPRDALARLETMALMAKLDLPIKVIREQIAASVDMIVQLERYEDGSRRISNITEVQGMEGDVITLQDIYSYERTGITAQGRVTGFFRRSAIRPAALAVFKQFGIFDFDQWDTRTGGG